MSESKVLVQVLLDYKSSDHFNLKFYIFESSDHRSNIIVYKLLTCNYSDFDFCVLDLLLIYSLFYYYYFARITYSVDNGQ